MNCQCHCVVYTGEKVAGVLMKIGIMSIHDTRQKPLFYFMQAVEQKL